jgi:AGCS family alanine or glycine:cation symporter
MPSFVSIFSDAFSGSAATGGFLGATFAYAFDRGVNRGLYSNEAGQGSAPIAHAAAKTDEATDEGMVSILEPFIDTIVICTITGLVILSSGVWNEKFDNQFQRADMVFVAGAYDQSDQDDVNSISAMLNGTATSAREYSGKISLIEGIAQNKEDFTLINSRSFAENIRFSNNEKTLSGEVSVTDGRLDDSAIVVNGKSLIHSVPLTTVAFTRGFFGDFGQYIVAVGLMLFAFSTAIAWSYYGDRAMTYLFGPKSVTPYRVVYVVAFFYAALADTTVVWNLALITIVLMTAPNLIGILVMHKEMRKTVADYWSRKN